MWNEGQYRHRVYEHSLHPHYRTPDLPTKKRDTCNANLQELVIYYDKYIHIIEVMIMYYYYYDEDESASQCSSTHRERHPEDVERTEVLTGPDWLNRIYK